MGVNPDSIPRYAPPTQAELEEIFGEPDDSLWYDDPDDEPDDREEHTDGDE